MSTSTSSQHNDTSSTEAYRTKMEWEEISIEEIVEGMKRRLPGYAELLVKRIPHCYSNDSQAVTDAILSCLGIPGDNNAEKTTLKDAQEAYGSLLCLTEVNKLLADNPGSSELMTSICQLLGSSCRGYLHWTLYLLGAPTGLLMPAEVSAWIDIDKPRIYRGIVTFFHTLFSTPTNVFLKDIQHEAMHCVLVALWTTLVDGHIPLYMCDERGTDPAANREEWVIKMLHTASQVNGGGLIRVILAGKICSPETFVERTVQRMVALSRISTLPHLAAMPSTTVENTNVGRIITLTETLIRGDGHLQALFTAAGAPKSYAEVALTTMKTFQKCILQGMSTDVGSKNDAKHVSSLFRATSQIAPQIGAILSWAVWTPNATISNMKGVLSGGAAMLVVEYLARQFFFPSAMHQTSIEAVWHIIEQYALHLRIIPLLCLHLRTSELMLHEKTEPRQPEVCPMYDFGADAQNVGRRITELGGFTKHCLRLCSNNDHYRTAPKVSKGCTRTCSRCHTVVYCSKACQEKDWAAFHKFECSHLAEVYHRRKEADMRYTYRNRSYHTTILRYSFESFAYLKELASKVTPSLDQGTDQTVVKLNILRPGKTVTQELRAYVAEVEHDIPEFLRRRFDSLISAFSDSKKTSSVSETTSLVTQKFRIGIENVNLLLLLKKVGSHTFSGNASEQKQQMVNFLARGPTASSGYVVQGSLEFTSPAEALPDHMNEGHVAKLLDPRYNDGSFFTSPHSNEWKY